MFDLLIIILLIVLNQFQSKRITKLERALEALKTSSPSTSPVQTLSPPKSSASKAPRSLPPQIPKPPIQQTKQTVKKPSIKKRDFSRFTSTIRDNWMGVVGALAVVIGAVFFGLTAEVMQNPIARVLSLLIFSLALVGVSFKLKRHDKWVPLSSWLTSISGAITLFISLGAGGIDGLRCIQHPIAALTFLCLGIGFNLFLALRSPSQFIASFHVMLSLISLSMIPQTPQLILIGAIVSSAGLLACFRHKWEIHLSIIVVMFAVQNTMYYFESGSPSSFASIISSVFVGSAAALVHYRKSYQHPKFDPLPFCAHILNWGLLGWNLFLYTTFSNWTPVVLGGVAIAGFILAQTAKRKKVTWLFYTDTILAQLIAIGALIGLTQFSLKLIDIAILISLEIFLFNYICNLQKEKILVRCGYFFQWASHLAVIAIAIGTGLQNDPFFYPRLGIFTLMNWGYYFLASSKNFLKDDCLCRLSSRLTLSISPILLTGSLTLFLALFYSDHSILIPSLIALFVLGLAFWAKKTDRPALDLTVMFSLVGLHLIHWNTLFTSSTPLIWNSIWLGALDSVLIFGMFLHSQAFKNKLYCVAIYGLSIHCILATYYYTKEMNPLIPAIFYLGYSLIALELSKLRYLKSLSHFFFQVGFGFVLAFLGSFILVHLQVQPVWKGVFVRWIIESLGLLTIAYWLFFPTKNVAVSKISAWIHQSFLEIFIGFLTLSIFAEFPEHWRAVSWALLAYAFLKTPKKLSLPKRIYLYSWGYLLGSIIHTTFLTHSQMLTFSTFEKPSILVCISIAFQIIYSITFFKQVEKIKISTNLSRFVFQSPCLSTTLPIFIGIGLMFSFNFERALLTLLWVGLICLYMMISLIMKSKRAVQLSLAALAICSLRLVIFDLTQQNLSVRALVFLGVGLIMLTISILYKKFKHRLELSENV